MTFKTEGFEKQAGRDKTHKIKVAIVLMYFGYGGAEKNGFAPCIKYRFEII